MKNDVTILYADDDLDDLTFFRDATTLISNKIRLLTHTRGDNLLQALRKLRELPEIIFLDLNMPGKNGFEVLAELKQCSEFRDIPVVIFSTACDTQNVNKSQKLGANFYVRKSSSFEGFKKSIEYALNINWKTFSPSVSDFIYH